MAFEISQFLKFTNKVSSAIDRLVLIDLDVIRGLGSLSSFLNSWEAIVLNVAREIVVSSLDPLKTTSTPAVIADFILGKLMSGYDSNLFFYRFRMNPTTRNTTLGKLQNLTEYGHNVKV